MAFSNPILSNFASTITFDEEAVNLEPQIIDNNVDFSTEGFGFDGGRLFLSGDNEHDIFSIMNTGTGAGEIGFDGTNITFAGVVIGTAAGGVASPLSVVFNANADSAAIEALIESLTYQNYSDDPAPLHGIRLNIYSADGTAAEPPSVFVGVPNGLDPLTGLASISLFNGIDIGSYSRPDFADLDGDGDLDLIIGEDAGNLNYYRNTGTSTAPVYTLQTGAADPFSGINIGGWSTPSFADLDGDGDIDLIVGESLGNLNYYRNTGTSIAPVYTLQSGAADPFDGIDIGDFSSPTFADIDGDGDLDLIIGDSLGDLSYYRNTGTSTAPVYTLQSGAADPFDGINSGAPSNPSFADLDGDGDLDLIIGEFDGNLNYYRNTGTSTAPVYTLQTGAADPFNGIDIGIYSAPTFADLDGDGDLDMIIGENDGTLNYYENVQPANPTQLVAQTGAADPFNGIDIGGSNTPSFADLDGDGDLDLIIGEFDGNLNYYRNTGTSTAPIYTLQAGAADPFSGLDIGDYSSPTFADLDGDGDLDLIIGEDNGILNYYRNTGTSTAPFYTLQTGATNPFNGIDIGFTSTPSFADLDGDGDLDLIIGESTGILNYYKNTGTSIAPVYTLQTGAADPFNGIDIGSFSAPTFADLDGDGDLDLIIGESSGNLNYYKNTGTSIAPVYTLQTGAADPFDGIDIGGWSTPSFADLDGDGDLDMIIGETDGNLNYYENVQPATQSLFLAQTGGNNPFNGIDIGGFSSSSFADLDGDGDLDFIIGETAGNLNYYRNTGTSTAPVYTVQTGVSNPFDGIDIGDFSKASFADLDGDGDLDLIIGDSLGDLSYYRNTGTSTAPVYALQSGAADPFDGINIGFHSTPSFGDLDGDGDLDLIIGELEGNLNYYRNTGTSTAPVYTMQTGVSNPFDGIDIGIYSAPSFADLDGDGDLDLFVGESLGNLSYYRNTGTSTAPVYTLQTGAADPFNGIDIGSYSTPNFADLDGDGDLDLIIGEQDGTLNYYENVQPVTPSLFLAQTGGNNPFNGIDIGSNSSPSFADIDGDGDLDLIIGESTGNLNYYRNTGTSTAPVYTLQAGAADPFNGIGIGFFSTPDFADLDGDGDLDLIIGEFDGNLNYYRNTGTSTAPVYTLQTGAADPFNGIDIGLQSTPTFADIDGDGDLDLIIGEFDGNLNYYQNTGTSTAPVYTLQAGATDPFNGIDIGLFSTPTFADLDGDGDLDLIIGEENGNLNYYKNTGTSTAPIYTLQTGAADPFDGIDIGFSSAPSFADLDGDGDLDLIIGENSGTLNYYENMQGSGFVLNMNLTPHADPSENADVIGGTSLADTLSGLGGDDIIRGFAGNDTLRGGSGADQLDGGAGDDILFVDANDTFINGGADYDRLFAEAGSLALNINLATSNLEYAQGGNWEDVFDATSVGEAVKLWGHGRDDTLTGSAFADYINGGAGNDTLNGLGGNDILDGNVGADIFNGGAGNDIMYIDSDDTTIDGGADYDQIFVRGYSAGVNINMTVGNLEYANGNTQNDIFNAFGATWSVKIFGQGGNDTLSGGNLADQLYGSDGGDSLSGNGGSDIISGGAGADRLFGGAGDDIIFVDADDLAINGGADYDRVYVTAGSAGVTINMAAAGVEFAYGAAGNDVFNGAGSTVAVKLQGRDGADTLTGGNVADQIYGGAGVDTINGGQGNDFLSGGADTDTFVFDAGWGQDTITDFDTNGETLDLSSLGITFGDLTVTPLGANHTTVAYLGNTITLLGVNPATIDASDFDFV